MNVGKSRTRSFYDAQWLFISGSALTEYQHPRRILVGRINLLLLFVNSDLETSMRNIQDSHRLGIALCAATKGEYSVCRIHRDVVSLAVLRVNVEAVVILVLRIGTLDDT